MHSTKREVPAPNAWVARSGQVPTVTAGALAAIALTMAFFLALAH